MSWSCPTTVSYICRCSTIRVPPVPSIPLVVPFVSPCLTILLFAVLFACSLLTVLGPVCVFAVRCYHARDGAYTSRLLYATLHKLLQTGTVAFQETNLEWHKLRMA
jgi:hypothetical protein